MGSDAGGRRGLARALTGAANASVAEALAAGDRVGAAQAWRIGITGAPGSGKSSLIARLAPERLASLAPARAGGPCERLAVLAIDPSSPVSHGALLGDRLRMEGLGDDPRLYVRSLSSRGGRDGLAHNIVDLLAVADAHGLDEVMIETVGTGQAEHAVRLLVDSLVLVLHPESGDSVQAMKAGIMEIADIYVVNKSDLAGARRTLAEVTATLRLRPEQQGWRPPVLAVSQSDPASFAALNAALCDHRRHLGRQRDGAALRRTRRHYHVRSLILRRLDELQSDAPAADGLSLAEEYRDAVARLAGP